MAGNDTAGPRPVQDLSYTEASRELDDIVRFFEQRDVDVDQLVGRLERATAIVDELDRRLRRTRGQVEELVPRLAAVLTPDAPHDDGATRGDGPGGSAGTGADDRPVEEVEEAELDEADELVEVMDVVFDDASTESPSTEGPAYDDGDPGPTEPPGLF